MSGVGTEFRGDGARAHDQESIGDPQRFLQIGGDDEDCGAVVGEVGDDAVDLLLGADVDSLSGFGQQEQFGPLDKLAGEHTFCALPPESFRRSGFRPMPSPTALHQVFRHLRSSRRSTNACPARGAGGDRSTR